MKNLDILIYISKQYPFVYTFWSALILIGIKLEIRGKEFYLAYFKIFRKF